MILEEILVFIFSLLPKCTFETRAGNGRRGQLQIQEEAGSSSQQQLGENREENGRAAFEEAQSNDFIHREYDISHSSQAGVNNNPDEPRDESHSLQADVNSSNPSLVRDHSDAEMHLLPTLMHIMPTIRESLQRSRKTILGTFLTILLAPIAIGLVYFELTRLCDQQRASHNKSAPFQLSKKGLISDQVEDVVLNLWFPATLVLLFGWTVYKKHYLSTFYIGCAFGAIVTIYKSYLFIFRVYTIEYSYLVLIGEAMIFVSIICSCILVARNFRRTHLDNIYSYFHIFAVIIVDVFAGIVLGWTYRLAFVPFFNGLENELTKAMFAVSMVTVALIPSAICYCIALKGSSGIIDPERSFLLVYIVHGVPVAIYRMMQADFNMLWLYIVFSVLHGIFNIIKKATQGIREKWWTALVERVNNTLCCCRRLELLPYNSPHKWRLDTDLDIQEMLFQYNVIILSQVYLSLYRWAGFQSRLGTVLQDASIRIAIGLFIELFFNYFSIFIQIHFYNLPIRRVWFKFWKRHVIANAILTMVMVLYFSPVFFRIYRVRLNGVSANFTITNCTLPF